MSLSPDLTLSSRSDGEEAEEDVLAARISECTRVLDEKLSTRKALLKKAKPYQQFAEKYNNFWGLVKDLEDGTEYAEEKIAELAKARSIYRMEHKEEKATNRLQSVQSEHADLKRTRQMTYFTTWEAFAAAVEQLYTANPEKCRFVTSFRHSDKQLFLKMTDDVICLKFRTDQVQDVRRVEKLTATLMKQIASS